MTDYLHLSLRLDKMKRQLLHIAANHADRPERLSETFVIESNAIRKAAAAGDLEWVTDRLQDIAFEAGIAEFDSSVLRLVRAGVMSVEELFPDAYCASNEAPSDERLLA